MSKVLVVGGAGYVGSAACAWLLDHGHDVVVLDDLSTGVRDLALGSRFIYGKAGDRKLLEVLFNEIRFDCVLHFAARSLVGESVLKPELYWENNVEQTRTLLEVMLETGHRRIVFSSSCAVFGDPGAQKITEATPRKPTQPYGNTKLEVERLLETLANERGLHAIALRYFNVAGAEPKLRVGECHRHETHLIPRTLAQAAAGLPVEIYGTDYSTPDGTCVRDFVDVWDLAHVHASAMTRLLNIKDNAPGSFEGINVGSDSGYSVREVIKACEDVLGRKLEVRQGPRRPGDPPYLVADSRKAREALGFRSTRSLVEMVKAARSWQLQWTATHPHRAVFLDRDGTLNEDPGYLSDPAQMRLIPGVGPALQKLHKAGFKLVVVSNQSGVARGLIDPTELPRIHARMEEQLSQWGVKPDRYELCLHHPDHACECRKPKPTLLERGARALGVDISRSFMVGDQATDVGAGRAAGCEAAILLRSGRGRTAEVNLKSGQADVVMDSLASAADWILDQGQGNSNS